MLKVPSLKICSKLYNPWRLTQWCKYSSKTGDILLDGTWNPPPICKGRKMEDDSGYCCPKSGDGSCPPVKEDLCENGTAVQTSEQMCCTDPRLKQDCDWKLKRHKKKKEKPPPFKSMWETIPNFKPPCDVPERLDNTLYKTSDKNKRIYRRTWKECEKVKVIRKKVCCFDEPPPLIPLERRKEEKPITACEQKEPELLKINLTALQECMGQPQTADSKCRKIRMPHCQAARKIVTCKKKRNVDCKRECAPYPSFSECVRDALKKGRPIECDCTARPMQCVLFDFLKKKEKYNIPPPLPAWPPERPK